EESKKVLRCTSPMVWKMADTGHGEDPGGGARARRLDCQGQQRDDVRHYDFVAIGGGSAGVAAVSKTAAAGRRTALVDRGPIGGLCSLNGCNPKKVLVRSTEVLDEIRRAAEFG